ncbi:MAG: helix-turn-helix transcriptional regulator [Treponema sp.]|jgi:transcriptional regulator with XRE-family HTH domain|nr:helix-turn-helix transcriptional regulator [Treponema sp.]
MDLDQLFVHNVRKWRKNRGFSQKSLAERCNAAHSYIRQIESGSGKPSFAFIGKLANALGVEAYQLFYDETAEGSEKSLQMDHIESIKTDFLEKMAHEFDTVVDKLKK